LLFEFTAVAQMDDLRLVIPIGHTMGVESVEFSPNGKLIATYSDDGQSIIWDRFTGKKIVTLKGIMPSFSGDGNYLKTHVASTGMVYVYKVTRFEENTQIINGNSKIIFSKFIPNTLQILTVYRDSTIKIWDGVNGKLKRVIKVNAKMIDEFNFSPDGKMLISNIIETDEIFNTDNHTIVIWDLFDEKKNEIQCEKYVYDAKFSDNGQKIIAVSEDDEAMVFDFFTNNVLFTLSGHTDYISSIRFSPDEQKIVSASGDNTSIIWNANTGKKLHILKGHTDDVIEAIFSKDSKLIVTFSYDNTIKIWNAKNGKLMKTINAHNQMINDVRFMPGESDIISSSNDRTVKIWNVESGKLRLELKDHSSQIKNAIINSDGSIFTLSVEKICKWNVNDGLVPVCYAKHNNDLTSYSAQQNKIATASIDSTVKVSDLKTGELLKNFTVHNGMVISAQINSNGTKVLSTAADAKVLIWEIESGKIEKSIGDGSTIMYWAEFAPNENSVITKSNSSYFLWNVENGSLMSKIPVIKTGIKHDEYLFSKKNDQVFTFCHADTLKIWSLNDGSLIKEILTLTSEIKDVQFSPLNDHFLTYGDSTLIIWDNQSYKMVFRIDCRGPIYSSKISKNNKIVISSGNDNIEIWDLTTHTLIKRIIHPFRYDDVPEFSTDERQILIINKNEVKIFDILSGELVNRLSGHSGNVNSIASTDGDFFLTSSNDNTCKLWDAKNGNLLVTFFTIDNKDYLIQNAEKYYSASRDAAKSLHYINDKNQIITFDQLDIKYNRPDLVLRSLGKIDTNLINSYYHAYLKRIKKLGIDSTAFTDGFSFPETDFKNKSEISYEQTNQELMIHFQGFDSSVVLDRFNVWINEVPVYGERGYSLRSRNTNVLDTTITIQLSEGENRIEASVSNTNAIESFRSPIYVNYSPSLPHIPKTHFIGIGIDKFLEPGHNLNYSVKDVRDFSNSLKAKLGNDLIVDTLFNENVNLSNVAALKKRLMATNINDRIIISYSGHGLLNSDYDYFLSAYNVDFKEPQNGGIPYEVLEDLLDSIPARKKLLLIDACHSGEVDKDDFREMNLVADAQGLAKPKGAGAENTSTTNTVGLQNSFQLMQELFVNVQKGSGATIISAAGGDQFALEGGKLENGFFTYAILQYLSSHDEVEINSLKKYVYEEVERLSGGLQKPTSRVENLEMNWRIW
jgi:WD40 repeat protein